MKKFVLGKSDLYYDEDHVEWEEKLFLKDNLFFKIDTSPDEGFKEWLVSKVLSYSTLKQEEYVTYEQCLINDRPGCYSTNFLTPEEKFVPMKHMYNKMYGDSVLSEDMWVNRDQEGRLDLLLSAVKMNDIDTSLYRDYLNKLVQLDLLILNPDRHTANYGIILPTRIPPIFDNGNSFNDNTHPCTLGHSYTAQVQAFGNPVVPAFKIDYAGLYSELGDTELTTSQQTIVALLAEQLEKYKSIFKM